GEVRLGGSDLTTYTGGGYLVLKDGGSASAGCGGSSGLATTSCTDTGLTGGTSHTYTIVPMLENWRGPAGAGRTITTAPTVTITFPLNGGGYNTTGWNSGASSSITGIATSTATITSVEIAIRQGSGSYWDPTANGGAGGI